MEITKVLLAIVLGTSLFGVQGSAKEKTYGLDHPHAPGELIVKFKQGVPKHLKDKVSEILKKGSSKNRYGINQQESLVVLNFKNEVSKNRSGASDLLAIAKEIDALDIVEYVEANNLISINNMKPSDPSYENLWAMEKVEAEKAWEISTGSRDVLVAVIDSGIDYKHEDLKSNIWTNPGESGYDQWGFDKRFNGRDDDHNGYVDDWRGWDFQDNDNDPMDENFHGTHVAGTIAASANNGTGVSGMAWYASLVGIRWIDDKGYGRTSNAIKAVNYASKIGVHIANNSWGIGSYSRALEEAINESHFLFVASAGNDSEDSDATPHYPSSYSDSKILSVGSSDSLDALSSFSNYGLYSIDVIAPGSSIYSTEPNDRYGYRSGTSMAAPLVTGIAVLIKAQYPYFTAIDIKNKIIENAEFVSKLTKYSTYGRVNAFKTLGGNDKPRCHFNYLYVNSNPEVGVYNPFCVMKYEAKYSYGNVATSKDDSSPWTNVSWYNARQACKANGYGYDLISNEQWQAVARSIESNTSNWQYGKINQGHNDAEPNHSLAASYDDNQGCFSTRQYCYSSWNSQKRTHKLKSGDVIWDVAGNVLEWTLNQAPSRVWNQYSAYSKGEAKRAYGPRLQYNQDSGLGYLYSDHWSYGSMVVRGGGFGNHDKTGIFATDLQHPRHVARNYLGFRCVHKAD